MKIKNQSEKLNSYLFSVNSYNISTFDDLLGTGVVHLLLGCVCGKHTIKHKRLPLLASRNQTQVRISFELSC